MPSQSGPYGKGYEPSGVQASGSVGRPAQQRITSWVAARVGTALRDARPAGRGSATAGSLWDNVRRTQVSTRNIRTPPRLPQDNEGERIRFTWR